jgi:hypothetical protein
LPPKIGALIPINRPDAERQIDHMVCAFALDASVSIPDAIKKSAATVAKYGAKKKVNINV